VGERPTPFDVVFGEVAEQRFPAIRDSLAAAGANPLDPDVFILDREAAAFVRDVAPDESPADAVAEMIAFVHAAFVFWLGGKATVWLERDTLDRLLREPALPASGPPAPRAYYLQMPVRRIWAVPRTELPPEPLDGCFVASHPRGIGVVAVFGMRVDREGFTVVSAAGPRSNRLARIDRTPLFSPQLAGGAGAGLHSLAGVEELLELGYRIDAALGRRGAVPGIQRLSLT
jgi:hypothetical protein